MIRLEVEPEGPGEKRGGRGQGVVGVGARSPLKRSPGIFPCGPQGGQGGTGACARSAGNKGSGRGRSGSPLSSGIRRGTDAGPPPLLLSTVAPYQPPFPLHSRGAARPPRSTSATARPLRVSSSPPPPTRKARARRRLRAPRQASRGGAARGASRPRGSVGETRAGPSAPLTPRPRTERPTHSPRA